MNRLLVILFLLFTLSPLATALAQGDAFSNSFTDPQGATKDTAHEDDMYNSATNALNEGAYGDAAREFDQLARLRGRRADAALYWKAYSLKQSGDKAQALAAIAELEKNYPQSSWKRDAGVLKVELQGTAANPSNAATEEEKLMALNAILQSDPDRALPYIDKLLHGASVAES